MLRTPLAKLLLIVTLGCGVMSVGSYLLLNYKTLLPPPATRSNTDFTYALLRSNPELFTSNDQPIFTIEQTEQFSNHWYVLTIAQQHSDNGVVGNVVIHDQSYGKEHMSVVAGPESRFSTQELESDMVPPVVIASMVKGRR